jgi:uncharacterized hydrophobic protein (TIGR00271 family)
MKSKILTIDLKKCYKNLITNYVGFDFDFFVFVISAAIICYFGFVLNSPSIIIGSMVLSPILYPVIALTMSITLKKWRDFTEAFFILTIGSLAVILISFILSFLFPIDPTFSEIASRIEASPLIYFIIAFISGYAGTFCFLWPKALEAITGVAIAIALLPPLVILGFALNGQSEILFKSFLVVFLNSLGIVLGGLLVILKVKLFQIFFTKI